MSKQADRARRLILGSIAATSLILPGSATATVQEPADVLYVDVGFDPDDVPIDEGSCCQQDPDIRSTRRRVFVEDGRTLFVNFHAYEPLLGYWGVVVRLDTRGGRRTDARMRIFDDGAGSAGCWVRFGTESRREGEYHAPLFGDRASCQVPLRWVHQNKRVRWRLISRAGGEGTEPGVDEFAPDLGWYP